MRLIDTHTHLYLEQFDEDRDAVVQSAIEKGVEKMLLPNIDAESIPAMQKLHADFPENCLQMMGLHPTSVNQDFEQELTAVAQELDTGKYIAVGEIGMDLYWDKTFLENQKIALRRQLQMARKHKLPVSIHTREAFDEIYEIVSDELTEDLSGVFHCFTGNAEQAQKIIDTGFKLGIGGVVTFKNSGLDKVLKDVPLEHLVLETDAPFLTPVPYRGKRNQSSYVLLVAEKLAEIKEVSVDEVAEITSATAQDVFNLTNQ